MFVPEPKPTSHEPLPREESEQVSDRRRQLARLPNHAAQARSLEPRAVQMLEGDTSGFSPAAVAHLDSVNSMNTANANWDALHMHSGPEAPAPKPAAPKQAGANAAGLANYEDLLGKKLGGKLYKAVIKQVTLEKMSKIASSGVNATFKQIGKMVKTGDKDVDPAEVDAGMKALVDRFGKDAEDWVQSEDGQKLQAALVGLVDANPVAITVLALIAAAAAYMANVEIPELKEQFDLGGGFSGGVAVNLGTIQKIAIQKLEANLNYTAGQFSASVTTFEEGDVSRTGANASLEVNKQLRLGLSGGETENKLAGDKTTRFDASANIKPSDKLGINVSGGKSSDGKTRFGADANYNLRKASIRVSGSKHDDDKTHFGAGVNWKPSAKTSIDVSGAKDGDRDSAALTATRNVNEQLALNLGANWNDQKGAGGQIGFDYKNASKTASVSGFVGSDQEKGTIAGIAGKWTF
jgi:hypothetical protein